MGMVYKRETRDTNQEKESKDQKPRFEMGTTGDFTF